MLSPAPSLHHFSYIYNKFMFSRYYHIKLQDKFHAAQALVMAGNSLSMRSPKPGRLWRKCSGQWREQKTRFYIIWRCTVILLRWENRF
ncbi:hypothetical protein L6164_012668 [Bauhinia variegata]|uniref:Uncharacterized protein n=1 Tax=Bauhinia variegata TaxID=167791 RepID=A0ACB9PG09_BAUVA|nr:hypothetical protein L6164_012668 [Bauhinia variegata]